MVPQIGSFPDLSAIRRAGGSGCVRQVSAGGHPAAARDAVGALAHRAAPVRLLEAGERFGLPTLPSSCPEMLDDIDVVSAWASADTSIR
jgi:hypothetical protein